MEKSKLRRTDDFKKFHGNRMASVLDLDTEAWRNAYQQLFDYSSRYVQFLLSSGCLDPAYNWPVDPLHNHTRLWEYPYALHQLQEYVPSLKGAPPARILDIGSALTFVPALLASRGYDVTAVDNEESTASIFKQLRDCADPPPGLRDFRYMVSDCQNMTEFDSESFDCVLCISVLEHLPNWESAIGEFWRVLRPQGVLIMTFDLKWDRVPALSDHPLDPEGFYALRRTVDRLFHQLEPEIVTHPLDILRFSNHPRELSRKQQKLKRSLLQRLRPFDTLLDRIRYRLERRFLGLEVFCVYGMSCRKNSSGATS